jgi:hypothetical protein
LQSAVDDRPRWLLVDTALLAQLPTDLRFMSLKSTEGVNIGIVSPTSTGPASSTANSWNR